MLIFTVCVWFVRLCSCWVSIEMAWNSVLTVKHSDNLERLNATKNSLKFHLNQFYYYYYYCFGACTFFRNNVVLGKCVDRMAHFFVCPSSIPKSKRQTICSITIACQRIRWQHRNTFSFTISSFCCMCIVKRPNTR